MTNLKVPHKKIEREKNANKLLACDADWRHIWDEQCVNFIEAHVKLSNSWRRESCEAGYAGDRSLKHEGSAL